MGFDITLMHRRGAEAAFHHHFGFSETLINIAKLVFQLACDIGSLAVKLNEIMQDRRIGLDRVFRVNHPGQNLIFHFDQLQRLGRHFFGDGGNGGDRVAMEQRLFARHDVAAHPAHILNAEHHGFVEWEIHHILMRHHGLHAGMRFRLRGIDGNDARMRVRAAQHLAPDHAGHIGIGGIGSAARHLFRTIGTDRVFADPFVGHIVHQAAPLISAAVSITARTILS